MQSNRAQAFSVLQQARIAAEAILQRWHVETGPVPVHEIVESCGIEFETVPMVSDGSISWRGKTARIRLNSRNGEARRRFTLAHEFGHFVLRQQLAARSGDNRKEASERDLEQDTAEERFCDAFASYLLVPDAALAWLGDWGSFSLQDVEREAERIHVSLGTLVWRIVEFAPGDGGAVLLDHDPKVRSGLVIRWAVFPKRAKFHYRKGEVVPFSADLHRAWKDGGEALIRDYPLKVGNFAESRTLRTKFSGNSLVVAVMPELT